MADQDYPNLYEDMEASAQRTRAAAIAFEHVLGGPEEDMVPVNGYPAQPTISGRVKTRLDPLVLATEQRLDTLVEATENTLDTLIEDTEERIDTLAIPILSAAESVKRFAGVKAVPPTTRYDGSPLEPGDEYQNPTTNFRYAWENGAWVLLNGSVQALHQAIADRVNPVNGAGMMGYNGRTLHQWLDDAPNALSYSGPTGQEILTAAIAALNANGGGTLTIPKAAWVLTGEVLATITSPIVLHFAGGTLTQTVDANLFNITLSGGGSINFSGSIDIGCSFAGRSATAAIIKATGSGKLRDFVISGVLRFRAGGNESQMKYGVLGMGLQEPDARGLLIYGAIGIPNLHMVGMRLTNGTGQASTSWKIWGPSCYGVLHGVEFYSTSYPGVEGIRIMAGDSVNCMHGYVVDASASNYVPPQFEMVSCHVNSFAECVVLNGVLNVKLLGGLLYRQGAGTTGSFIDITDCQDITVLGTSMHCITAGLDIPGVVLRGVTRPIAFASIDACHFWLNPLTQPCVRLVGNVASFALGGTNKRATGATWLDYSGVTSSKSGIMVSPMLSSTANDAVRTTFTPSGGVLDLRESLTTNILLAGVTSTTVITSIIGRKGWTYNIRSDVAGVAFTPSATINIAGATANYAYYIAGGFLSFFMDGDTSARLTGGSISKSLRAPILPVQMSTHASGSLPSAAGNGGSIIMITGIESHTIPGYSEGTNWRRLDTFAIVT